MKFRGEMPSILTSPAPSFRIDMILLGLFGRAKCTLGKVGHSCMDASDRWWGAPDSEPKPSVFNQFGRHVLLDVSLFFFFLGIVGTGRSAEAQLRHLVAESEGSAFDISVFQRTIPCSEGSLHGLECISWWFESQNMFKTSQHELEKWCAISVVQGES